MWVEGIHVTGFGVFCNAEVSNLPPGLCLFIGDNEAGKSTLLAFIRFMLYGMSKKKSEDGNRYLPLNGGKHAGILQIRTAQSELMDVHRDFASVANSISVFDSKNIAVASSEFEKLLVGTNRELYRNVYAFSLQELQNLASLEADQIKSVLYGAAMGAGILALPKAQKALSDKIGEIFKPTGALPRLNKKLSEVSEFRKAIEEIQKTLSVSRFDDINNQLRDLDQALRGKLNKLDLNRKMLADVDSRIKHYPEWCRLADKVKEVNAIIDESDLFPENGLTMLETELASLKFYSKNQSDAQTNLDRAKSDAQLQVVDKVLLQFGNEIDDVRKDVRRIAQCYNELPDHREQLTGSEQVLKEKLSSIGDGWDRARISNFSDIDKTGQSILEFQSRFGNVASTKKASEELRNSCVADLERFQIEEEDKRDQLKSLGPTPKLPDKAKLRELRDGFQKCEGALQILDEKKSEYAQVFESLQHLQQQIREASGTKDGLLLLPESLVHISTAMSTIRLNRDVVSRHKIEQYKETARKANQQVMDARKEHARTTNEIATTEDKLDKYSAQLKTLDTSGEVIDSVVVDEVRRESGVLARLSAELDGVSKELEAKRTEYFSAAEALGVTTDSDCFDDSALCQIRTDVERLVASIDRSEKEVVTLTATLSAAQHSYAEALNGIEALERRISELRANLADSEDCLHEQLNLCGRLRDEQVAYEKYVTNVTHLEERLKDKQRSFTALREAAAKNRQLVVSGTVLAASLVVGLGIFVTLNQAAGALVAILGCAAFIVLKSRVIPDRSSQSGGNSAADLLRNEAEQIERELASQKQSLESTQGEIRSLSDKLMVDSSTESVNGKRKAIQEMLEQWKELSRLTGDVDNKKRCIQTLESEVQKLKDLITSHQAEIASSNVELTACFTTVSANLVASRENAFELMVQLEALRRTQQTLSDSEEKFTHVSLLIAASVECLRKLTGKNTLHTDHLTMCLAEVEQWLQSCPTRERANRQVGDLQFAIKELTQNLQELALVQVKCDDAVRAAQEKEGLAKDEWGSYLSSHGLRPDLSFESAMSLCDFVESAATAIQKLTMISDDYRQQDEDAAGYFKLATELANLTKNASLRQSLVEVKDYLASCEEAEGSLRKNEEAAAILESCKSRCMESREALESAERRLQDSIRDTERLHNEWRSWLVDKGLDSTLEPGTAYDAVQVIRSCRDIIAGIDCVSAKLRDVEVNIQSFVERCTRLYKAINRNIPEIQSLFEDLEELGSAVELEQKKAGAYKQADENLTARVEANAAAEKEFKAAQDRVGYILSRARSPNEQDFRERHANQVRRRDIMEQIASLESSLLKSFDATDAAYLEENYHAFELGSAKASKVDLEAQISRVIEEVDGTVTGGEQTSGLRYEISKLQSEREVVARSRELTDLRLKLERAIAEADSLAKEWTRLSVTNVLLQRAQKRFEREGQPHVLALASEYFSRITGNAYTGISVNANSKSNKLEAVKHGKTRVSGEVLSTGTQEQLYLSLRFGFIRHRACKTEPLPIIMDDILVNFDPSRAHLAAETILKLSGADSQQQILVFTCHPATVDLFKQLEPSVRIVELRAGKLTSIWPVDMKGTTRTRPKPDWLVQ